MAFLAFLYCVIVAAWLGVAMAGEHESNLGGWLSVSLLTVGLALSAVVLL